MNRQFFILYLIFCTLAAASISGQTSLTPTAITIANFKAGGENYTINGEQAIISGNMVRINQLNVAIQDPQGDIQLHSDACDFDQIKRVAASSEPVQVKGKNLEIAGVGFDLNLAEQRIVVRDQVKVRIHHGDTLLPE